MKEFLSKFHKIDESILEEYLSHWQPYQLPKKTIMTEEGQTERYIYFVLEGVQKSYCLSDDKEHITFFAYPPSFSGVMESFFTQTPSKFFLETISDSQFLRLSYHKHEALLQEHQQLETLFRKVTEKFLLAVIHRYYELMAYNIETRFKVFAKRSPHLLNMVSQKDLSSYLRIDPSNFSKLINKIQI